MLYNTVMALNFEHYQGLSTAEIVHQQKKSGKNVLFVKKRKGFFDYILHIFQEPMLLLLLATAIIYFVIGKAWDGVLMIVGVLVMISIDLYQEAKTDKALEALKELSTPKITVIREGRLQTINNEELVVGDTLVIREGERIAGDGQIKESSSLSVDESMLTGESGAIYKSDKVFAGTLVLSGQAVIKVTAIGVNTQYGNIGKSLAEIQEPPTPLQKKTGKLVKIFGIIGFCACLALFLINYAHTQQLIDSLLKGLTLAISVIPEELPVVLTVFSALGAYRLTQKNALIRRINAIETLGSITTLCTDKTGTLTMNRMELQTLFIGHDLVNVKQIDRNNPEHIAALSIAALACQPEPFDPADLSIFAVAKKFGLDADKLHGKYKLLREYGFDQHLRAMGHAWSLDGKALLAIKGSAEQIIDHCLLEEKMRRTLLDSIEQLSSRGLRVLAVAQKKLAENRLPKSLADIKDLEFVSLIAFHDPPKEGARQAVLACQRAGITVRMITGDHPQTALHIAEAVGIKHNGRVINGSEIESLPEDELIKRIKGIYVFSRIIPDQKLKIVHALQRMGEIVAMIGDGVNDAPSLKEANVGIAMGRQGTNVAREAADMVLMDDQLNTVVNTIHDGRRIYDNIQKAVSYVFGIHVYIILIALAIPLMNLPALLLPIHIIILELIIDPTCALVFEAMPAEPDIMRRKPRDPQRPLISTNHFLRVFLRGLSVFVLAAGAYIISLKLGYSNEVARTMGFSTILWSNLFQVIGSVSKTKPTLFSLDFLKNKTFIGVYAIMMVAFVGLVYLPKINAHLGLTAIPIHYFLLAALLGFIPALGGDIYKKIRTLPR